MTLDRFSGANAGYVLELYEKYRQDPQSVDAATREVFESWTPADAVAPAAAATAPAGASPDVHVIVGAANLAESIRRFGHLAAQLDPLGSAQIGDSTLLPKTHGITDDDLKRLPASLVGGPPAENSANAYEAIEKLRRVYCSTTGFDIAHLFVPDRARLDARGRGVGPLLPAMDPANAEALLDRITQVEVFERFLQRTFTGKTRFSIEGLDMLLPILDEIMAGRPGTGTRHMMLGMAHRGRLNVLAHILQKPYAQILAEFKDPIAVQMLRLDLGFMGDVKYHAAAPRNRRQATCGCRWRRTRATSKR
jgi:2-oxoglutarate dehydrogenase E1 component